MIQYTRTIEKSNSQDRKSTTQTTKQRTIRQE